MLQITRSARPFKAMCRLTRTQRTKSALGNRMSKVEAPLPSITQLLLVTSSLMIFRCFSFSRSFQPGNHRTSRSNDWYSMPSLVARSTASVVFPPPEQPMTSIRLTLGSNLAASDIEMYLGNKFPVFGMVCRYPSQLSAKLKWANNNLIG